MIPVAMLVVFLAVQMCLWAHATALVQSAAVQGDLAACVENASDQTGVTVAHQILAEAGEVVPSFSVQATDLPADLVELKVTGTAESIFPWIRLPVSAVKVGTRQEFRVSG